jgi:hypothetical protein
MNRIKNLLAVFSFSLLVLTLPGLASAQGNNRDRNRNDRNNGYYNTSQLKSTIKRLKSDSKDFAKFVDRDLDKSRYDGSNREDNLNQLAKNFRDAASRLESSFGNGRNLNDSSREAQNILSIANRIDRQMGRARLSSNVENYWRNIDSQLSEIARAYNRGNRGWRN